MKKVAKIFSLIIKKIRSQKAKQISNIIGYVLIGIFVLFILVTITSKFPLARHQLLTVLSGSMEPKIKTGSVVLVKGATDYKVGDVITFQGEKKFPTTHRIVEITEGGYVTQGDANNAPDMDKVAPENVIGKAILSIPYLGYAVNASKTPAGFTLIIIIPALLIIFSEVSNIWKEVQRIRHQKKVKQAAPSKTAKKMGLLLIFVLGASTLIALQRLQATNAYFSDQAKIEGFQITAWSVEPGDVLINEFLPNPEGEEYGFDFGDDADAKPQGEWVELYNTTSQTIDLADYYLTDADGHRIDVENCRTDTGGTTITSNGFLVVYRKGSDTCTSHNFSLNNNGDTVNLYNDNDQLFDSHSYSGGDYCDLEPTPGEENADNPSGGCTSVPPNKSYARIPDGSNNWVDPVPTPGKPNILGDEDKDLGPALPEPGEENYEEDSPSDLESLPLPEPNEKQNTESSPNIPAQEEQEENENLENNESQNGEDLNNSDDTNLDIVSDCTPAISEIEEEDPNPESEENEEEGENQQEEEMTEPEVTEPQEGNFEQESPEPTLDNPPSSDNMENNEEETEGEITENEKTQINEESESNENSKEPETNPEANGEQSPPPQT